MALKVDYSIFGDMKRNIPEIKPEDFIITSSFDETDELVFLFARNYYDRHMPVDLEAWMRVNIPDDSLIYKGGYTRQISFIMGNLQPLLCATFGSRTVPPMVISCHSSKSVKLPVYQLLDYEKYGIEIILRNNFHDWKVSVKSDIPIEFTSNVYKKLFTPYEDFPYYACEGFPKDKVYGSYEQNHNEFTVEIRNNYNLYTFMLLLLENIENERNKE